VVREFGGPGRQQMGTRISVFLEKDFPLFGDKETVLTRLRQTEATCGEVARYWRNVDPTTSEVTEWEQWAVLGDYVRYAGPGSLGLVVARGAARIYTGARWRGFLSIPPLRLVHLEAFRSIGAALGSQSMAITHDSTDAVHETFADGGTLDDCLAALQATMGSPQHTIDAIDPDVVSATEREVPNVWFLERISPTD